MIKASTLTIIIALVGCENTFASSDMTIYEPSTGELDSDLFNNNPTAQPQTETASNPDDGLELVYHQVPRNEVLQQIQIQEQMHLIRSDVEKIKNIALRVKEQRARAREANTQNEHQEIQ